MARQGLDNLSKRVTVEPIINDGKRKLSDDLAKEGVVLNQSEEVIEAEKVISGYVTYLELDKDTTCDNLTIRGSFPRLDQACQVVMLPRQAAVAYKSRLDERGITQLEQSLPPNVNISTAEFFVGSVGGTSAIILSGFLAVEAIRQWNIKRKNSPRIHSPSQLFD